MDELYFAIPKGDPLLLIQRAQRARLEVGVKPKVVFPASPNPDLTALITLLYLKHVEDGETDILVEAVVREAVMAVKSGVKVGPRGRGISDFGA